MHRLQSGPVFSHQTGAVRSQKIGPDRMTVQTGLDRGIVLRSGPKIRDRTAYKSVRFGPVPVSRSSPVSLSTKDIPEASGTFQELVKACIQAKQARMRVNTKGEALSQPGECNGLWLTRGLSVL